MRQKKFLILLFFLPLIACRDEYQSKSHEQSVELINKATQLIRYSNIPDSSLKALAILDSATTIDSNHFLGYHNKLLFLDELHQYDRATSIINKLIRMRPLAYDLYFIGGILYYRASDTITSNAYFKKSLRICNAVLDTMKSRSWEYYGLVINKAVVLKILGNNKESDLVFKKLQDSTIDDQIKARTKTIMSKSRIEILSK